MPNPLPRKLEFVCTRVEARTNRGGLVGIMLGAGALLAGLGAMLINAGDIPPATKLVVTLGLSTSAVILGFFAVRFYSDTPTLHRASKIEIEVGLDGLRLPLRAIPFGKLQTIGLETTPSSYSTLELVLNDGESIKLSMLDGEPVARLIRERHELFKQLTAPRPRARADGYRGVRIAEEPERIEEAIRQGDWGDVDIEAMLVNALVIPADER